MEDLVVQDQQDRQVDRLDQRDLQDQRDQRDQQDQLDLQDQQDQHQVELVIRITCFGIHRQVHGMWEVRQYILGPMLVVQAH